jgi:hypothetical protein
MSCSAASLLFSALILTASAAPPEPAASSSRLDAVIAAEWTKANVSPDAPANDAAFLRRVWLDLAGRVPPVDQARTFLDDPNPDKRTQLVDMLLASDDFADHWGDAWTQRLTGKRTLKQDKYDGRVLREHLRKSLAANKSYRDVVSEMLTAEGPSDSNGAVNFLLRYEGKPTDLAGAVGKQFLGITLQCAQCHDHPFARWKQDDFWGVAAFFGRVRLLEYSNDETGEYLTAALEARRGELEVPDTSAKPGEDGKQPKKKVKMRLPNGETPTPKGARRPALAQWVTADNNPYFSRHAVNWVWGQLFGTNLALTLDKLDEDPGRHPAILNLLAEDFAAHGYDLKRLVRTIVLSRAYQSSAAGGEKVAASDEAQEADAHRQKLQNLARFPTRPLSVDQLYQSIVQATGHKGVAPPEPPPEPMDDPEEENADHSVDLLTERALTVQRALAQLNGAYVHEAAQAGAKAAVEKHGEQPTEAHIEWLFLATLSRRPTEVETKALLQLAKEGEGTSGLEDVVWAILNSAEFNTNH